MYVNRREKIHELLENKHFVSLAELCEMFPEYSSMTLRRDIEYFEEQGEAIKVRGGARSMKFITTSMEDSFKHRSRTNIAAKEKIAEAAVKMIEPGRSVFIDSGSTALCLASAVPDDRINVITTGPNVALELAKKTHTIINLVGGMFNRDSVSLSGAHSLKFISDVNIDIAFIVPSGVSADNGFTSGNYMESDLKSLIIEKARKTVVLMDTSKIGKSLPYTFSSLADVDCIITDKMPQDDDFIAAVQAAGTELIVPVSDREREKARVK